MKKKIIALAIVIISTFYGAAELNAQWATIDVSAIAQQAALNSKVAQQIMEQIKQTGIMDSVSNFAKRNLDIAKKYYEDILRNPNGALGTASITNNKYSSLNKYYVEVFTTTAQIGFLSTLANKESGTTEALNIGVDVASFMSYVRDEANDINKKQQELEIKDKFSMTDAERINLMMVYEKEMRNLLSATQLYVIRAQRVIIGKKAADKDANQTFSDL
jgi:hypothetical protein